MADRFRTGLDWDDLRVFVALARHGSLSAAARALSVNHATVARRIARLERRLGDHKLFERRPDGYGLTPAGRAVLEQAGAMEAAAARLARAGPRQGVSGLVRVSAPPSLADAVVVPRLAELSARHPGLDIEVAAERRPVSLTRREADLALRLGEPADGYVVAKRIARIGFGFYATPDWAEKLAGSVAPVFVGFDEANAHLPEAVWLARRFPNARIAFRANTQLAQAKAARSGCGIALLPDVIGHADAALTRVDLGERPPARDLFVLHHVLSRTDVAVRIVRDVLVALFAGRAVAPEAERR